MVRCDRLLDRASDPLLPLGDRLGSLAGSATTLDEWYQHQVGGSDVTQLAGTVPLDRLAAGTVPLDRLAAGAVPLDRLAAGAVPLDRLAAVHDLVDGIVRRQSAVVSDHLLPALARDGVPVVDLHTLDGTDRAFLDGLFDRSIFPTLTPLAVDHGHPFPYISTLSLNLVVRVRHARAGGTRLARVKVPSLLPRFVPLPDGVRVVPVEQVIAAHVGALFPSMAILEAHALRVTRTALHPLPVDREGSPQGPAGHQLHRRHFGPVVRLEVASTVTPDLLATVATGVGVPGCGVFEVAGLLDPGALTRLTRAVRTDRSPERAGDSLRRIAGRPMWPQPLGPWPSTALRGLGRQLLRWIP